MTPPSQQHSPHVTLKMRFCKNMGLALDLGQIQWLRLPVMKMRVRFLLDLTRIVVKYLIVEKTTWREIWIRQQ